MKEQLKAKLPLWCKEILHGKTNPIPLLVFPLGIPGLGEREEQCFVSLLKFVRPVVPPKYRNRAICLLLQLAVSRAQLGLRLYLSRRIFLSLVTLEVFTTCRLVSLHGEKNGKN